MCQWDIKFHDLILSSTIMVQITFPFIKILQRQNEPEYEENNVKIFSGFILFETKGVNKLVRIKYANKFKMK